MEEAPNPSVAGEFKHTPQGVVLHGSRSGLRRDRHAEFRSTVNYAVSGANGLAWHATVGDDVVALHMPCGSWGYHARSWSSDWLGVEFAQATVEDDISDGQVDTVCWWFKNVARKRWPTLPAHFIGHAEIPPGILDGNTDPYPNRSAQMQGLRKRILGGL